MSGRTETAERGITPEEWVAARRLQLRLEKKERLFMLIALFLVGWLAGFAAGFQVFA